MSPLHHATRPAHAGVRTKKTQCKVCYCILVGCCGPLLHVRVRSEVGAFAHSNGSGRNPNGEIISCSAVGVDPTKSTSSASITLAALFYSATHSLFRIDCRESGVEMWLCMPKIETFPAEIPRRPNKRCPPSLCWQHACALPRLQHQLLG